MDGENDVLRKRVHRQAAVELGVPPYLAFRAKDPAQSGSGIHQIIKQIAARKKGKTVPRLVKKNMRRDKGSLYRYEEDTYGDDATRFYLQQIEEKLQKKFIPPFLAH
jgi:asparagine synthase (glutamine-hydrolysing)